MQLTIPEHHGVLNHEGHTLFFFIRMSYFGAEAERAYFFAI